MSGQVSKRPRRPRRRGLVERGRSSRNTGSGRQHFIASPANPPAWQARRLARHFAFMWIGPGIVLRYREAILQPKLPSRRPCNGVDRTRGGAPVSPPQFLVGLRNSANGADNGPMGGRSRQRIFGDRVQGARINALNAREQAKKAIREADAAECLLWSEQMEASAGQRSHRPRSRNASMADMAGWR